MRLMRVLVAGASGAAGKALVPMLARDGHAVGGIVSNPAHVAMVKALEAQPLLADALDRPSVIAAFESFRPEAVVHQLTALPSDPDLRDFDKVFARTNRLRTEGTDNLVAASRRVGVRRFVAQSFSGWNYARTGGPIKTEDDALDPDPLPAFRRTLDALRHVERAMAEASDLRGVALRYGGFYGPGTFISRSSSFVEQVRRRRVPVVGDGGGIWSFVHMDDVAGATIAALKAEHVGTFNVVDDEPAQVREWLPELARVIGARRPFRFPAGLARFILPKHLIVMMTEVRGASNAKFKRTFSWQPTFASWRDGFRHVLA
jgi:nucleoside-diphosphate-sugar epimerase